MIGDIVIVQFSLLACSQCAYDRVMSTWYVFAAIRVGVVLVVAKDRLDLVRILGLFALFEAAYFLAWRFLVWYSHPSVSGGTVEKIASAGLLVLSVGVPAVAVLWCAAQVPYFRKSEVNRLSLKRALLLIPSLFVVSLLQPAV